MYTKLIQISFWLICFLIPMLENAHAAEINGAENVVENYMQALIEGDTTAALSFLSANLVDEKKTLFNNPAYSQQLRVAYVGAEFEIVSSEFGVEENVFVETKIILPNNDKIIVQFEVESLASVHSIIAEQ